MRKLNILTKIELKTLVLPERPAKLNESLRFKVYLISAWKDHPPTTLFEKTGGGQKYTAAKYVSPKLGPDDNK